MRLQVPGFAHAEPPGLPRITARASSLRLAYAGPADTFSRWKSEVDVSLNFLIATLARFRKGHLRDSIPSTWAGRLEFAKALHCSSQAVPRQLRDYKEYLHFSHSFC